jgi:hypothetical protein
MSTVGLLIDRTFRTWLEPPDAQPATARLGLAIDDNDTSVTFSGFALIEDELLLRPEAQIEIDSELLLLTAYDTTTSIATVERAAGGTTAAAHALNARIKIAPPYARLSVFDAIADNIITLYPDLYSVDVANISTVGGNVAAIEDPLAVEVIEVWDNMHTTVDTEARIVDFHPLVGGRAVIGSGFLGNFWIRYRRRFGSATAEADSLADLGVDPRWNTIVMVGACADLFAGRDIPASHTSWVQGVLEAENIPVGTRMGLAMQLANYRQRLLNEAKQEMRAEYKAKVRQMEIVQTSWWG